MSTSRDPLRLATFPPASSADWREHVGADGRSFERLVDRRVDRVERQPLYGPEDEVGDERYLGPLREDGGPRVGARPWRLVAELSAASASTAAQATAAGADLLWIRGNDAAAVDPSTWLDAVGAETSVVLDAGADTLLAAARGVASTTSLDGNPWARGGGFAFDPLGVLARRGTLPGSLNDAWKQAVELAAWCDAEAPEARAVRASGSALREAGGSAVDELAFLLASGTAWLRAALDEDLPLSTACRRLRLELTIGPDLFAEIARIRAARLAWGRVVAAFGGDAGDRATWIDARTTRTDHSVLDAWTNQLRSTGGATAAILGGVDSLRVAAWDEVLSEPGDSGSRLAVNLQHMLGEEAHLGRVGDPAGGSWYLEKLTDDLALAAWDRFREIEAAGGAARALAVGCLAAWVEETTTRRGRSVARRRYAYVGVSESADPHQVAASAKRVERDLSAEETERAVGAGGAGRAPEPEASIDQDGEELGDLFRGLLELAEGPASNLDALGGALWQEKPARAPALEPLRWPERFETLRHRADALRTGGEPPTVFLASVGKRGALRSRILWVQNALAAGGLVGDDPDRVFQDVGSALDAFRGAGSSLVVVSSVDADWPDLIPDLVPRLREAGARHVVLAGRSADPKPLLDAGVDAFLHVGCDVANLLGRLLGTLEDEDGTSGRGNA